MATAMQSEVASSEKRSVSEEMFWSLLPYPKTPGADEKLYVLAEVCTREAAAVVKAAEPDQWCFGVSVLVSGKWASKALSSPHMTMENYPRTKKRLCAYVADGWLGCRRTEDEQFFADILRNWPAAESKEAADKVREMIEFRMHPENIEDLMRLGRFFLAPQMRTSEDGSEVTRTVFKAIGRYANAAEVVLMGQAFCVLQGRLALPFKDFVKNGLA